MKPRLRAASDRSTVTRLVIALGMIGCGLAFAHPAGAQSVQQIRWCNGDDHATSEQSISGCTALIQSGKSSRRNLAIAYTNRGSAYDDLRDEDRAIADQDQAIKIDPKLDLAFNNRANAYGRKGEIDRALADYDEAIRLNPKFFRAINNRGTTYRDDKRDPDRAITDYNEAIRLSPKFADAYNNRGIAYAAKGDHAHALADYNSAIRLDPNFALAYNNRGLQYRDHGDYVAAIADFDKAIGVDPRYANAYRNRGNAYLKMDKYDLAISDFTTALVLNAKDTETLIGRATAYGRTGDLDRAIADYDGVLRLEPQDLTALTNRGYAHFHRGDFADAAADLSRVTDKDAYTYPALFRFLAQSRAGLASSDLESAARRMTNQSWPYAVFELYLGRRDADATLAAAQGPEERCEAQFYVGEWHLLQGDRVAAKLHLEEVAGVCPKGFVEYVGAQAELRRLAQ